jgi:hypothetical protein
MTSPGWMVNFLKAVKEGGISVIGKQHKTVAPHNSLAFLQSNNLCFCTVLKSFIFLGLLQGLIKSHTICDKLYLVDILAIFRMTLTPLNVY